MGYGFSGSLRVWKREFYGFEIPCIHVLLCLVYKLDLPLEKLLTFLLTG